ncbi:hypothetical protein AB0A94_34110 [Streptomyces sp. NPDC044984]|uniref:hypothetical protein n=1 Tax=unclassified Streptomyces TaxID=2593676 RepID=UPI0018E4A965|nr:hypothetical protein [Streptomyces sp. DH-12]
MSSSGDRLDQAADAYASHLRDYRQCRAGARECQAAKFLRRAHNNLLREARRRSGAERR